MLALKRSDNVALKQICSSAMGYKTSFMDWRHLDGKMNRLNVYEIKYRARLFFNLGLDLNICFIAGFKITILYFNNCCCCFVKEFALNV